LNISANLMILCSIPFSLCCLSANAILT